MLEQYSARMAYPTSLESYGRGALLLADNLFMSSDDHHNDCCPLKHATLVVSQMDPATRQMCSPVARVIAKHTQHSASRSSTSG